MEAAMNTATRVSRTALGGGLTVALLLAGCAGYNLSLGTSADGTSFYQVFEVPATSLRPWTERRQAVALPPPPDGEASSVTTLPAGPGSAGAMPPEK